MYSSAMPNTDTDMQAAIRQARAYANTALETGVAAAGPHQLVLMLFDGAIVAITQAAEGIQRGDVKAKAAAIAKAIQIVDEGLQASLNDNAGGPLAAQLRQLYDYASARLLLASLKNEIGQLTEVRTLLAGLREAWAAIGEDLRRDARLPRPRLVHPITA